MPWGGGLVPDVLAFEHQALPGHLLSPEVESSSACLGPCAELCSPHISVFSFLCWPTVELLKDLFVGPGWDRDQNHPQASNGCTSPSPSNATSMKLNVWIVTFPPFPFATPPHPV